ncbi:short-chain dehydrogenase [Nocardioides sp. Root1257]|nr:short-chain dehydrogenase [Nocardioides sp. Root1257]KRC43386.1 short-chain dehydrogenase [Nocardioides sp. Root224]
MSTWLITGCSSGLGRALAEAVLENGDNVVMTVRTLSSVAELVERYPQRARAAQVDVRDGDEIVAAVGLANETFGGVDVLVNNAGHGYRAAVEEAPQGDIDELFATNLFGPLNLIKAVLPQMRARRSGTILNVSSIGGRRANPGSGYYSATKFALEGLSDALAKEVGPLGIRVVVIEPGGFRTDFAGRSLHQSAEPIGDYAATAGVRRKENDSTHGTQPGDPERAARALVNLIEGERVPFRLLLGTDAIASIRSEVEGQLAEIAEWESVSASTDFES